jgi:hypothetical protein
MKRWFDSIQARPAVVKVNPVMDETRKNSRPMDDPRCISARPRQRFARMVERLAQATLIGRYEVPDAQKRAGDTSRVGSQLCNYCRTVWAMKEWRQ